MHTSGSGLRYVLTSTGKMLWCLLHWMGVIMGREVRVFLMRAILPDMVPSWVCTWFGGS